MNCRAVVLFRFFLYQMAANGASVLPAFVEATVPPPVLLMPVQDELLLAYSGLTRQIREDYWTDAENYMQKNPAVEECEVLTNNYEWGWVHKVVRAADGSLQRISKYETSRDFRQTDFKEPESQVR